MTSAATLAPVTGIQATLNWRRGDFSLDVDLNLPLRGVTALFGPSGCGKTTVLRAVAGLLHCRGRVALGDDVWQDEAGGSGDPGGVFVPTHRRALGYVIQDAALFTHLSVRANLEYGLRRIAPSQRRISLDQAIEMLGIGGLLARRPVGLSGGERQRVAIARALATSPRLMLMDEPLSALDAQRKAEVLPYLDRLHEELSIPVIYVSHSIDEVARLADHLVVMDAGRVTAQGPLVEMLGRLDLPVPFGSDFSVVLDAVVGERDTQWQLARVDIGASAGRASNATLSSRDAAPPCSLWARDQGFAVGRRVRVRVLARDVSVTREPQAHTSIGNQLRGSVEAIGADSHPALALVRVRVGEVALVAQLSRRSASALQLVEGAQVWLQVKTVALME